MRLNEAALRRASVEFEEVSAILDRLDIVTPAQDAANAVPNSRFGPVLKSVIDQIDGDIRSLSNGFQNWTESSAAAVRDYNRTDAGVGYRLGHAIR